jgi:hypothetical protein
MDRCHWCWTWHLTRLSSRKNSLRNPTVDEEVELLLLLVSTGGGISSSSLVSSSSMAVMTTSSLQLKATFLGDLDGLMSLLDTTRKWPRLNYANRRWRQIRKVSISTTNRTAGNRLWSWGAQEQRSLRELTNENVKPKWRFDSKMSWRIWKDNRGENRTGRHLKLNSRMKLRCGRLKYQIFQFSSVTEFLVMSDAFLRNWLHSGGGLKFVPTGVA